MRIPDKSTAAGFRNLCAPCRRARKARDRARSVQRVTDRGGPDERGEKACTHCKAIKPLLAFGGGSCRDGRNSWCRSCMGAASRALVKHRRATDPAFREAINAQKRQDRRAADPDLSRRDADRAAQAALRADHKAHVVAYRRHLSRCHAHVDAWEAHVAATVPVRKPVSPAQVIYERAKSAYRRARRLGRLAPWCRIRDTLPFYAIAAAHEQATGVEWHVDHQVPLRAELASGLHCPANLTFLPRAENQAKSNSFSLEHQ